MLELTKNGKEPISIVDGMQRSFLEDGDTIILSGSAGPCKKVGFCELKNRIMKFC
jgi:fumarylacetoacetase